MLKAIRQLDRRLVTILLVVFAQMVGSSMVVPLLPIYAQREFALDERIIPLLISIFFAAQFIAGPWIGRLSDEYGRVPILVISQIGTAISFLMMASAQSVWMLFFARVVDGITGGNIVVAQAYVTDIMPEDRRTEALGLVLAAIGSGIFFGPALAGFVSSQYGPRMPFWVACVAISLLVVLTRLLLNETVSAENRAKSQEQTTKLSWVIILKNRMLANLLAFTFLNRFIFGLLQSTIALWALAVLFRDAPQESADIGIGLIFSTFGITQLLTQAFILRPLIARLGELNMIYLGTAMSAFGVVGFALAKFPIAIVPAIIVLAMGLGISRPPLQALATRFASERERGGVLGFYQSAVSVGIIFGTASAGFLFGIGPTVQYWVSAILLVISFGWLLLLRPRLRQEQA